MRKLLGALCVLAIILLMQAPAAAAEEIICGKILGSSAPTATAPGAFVIPKPGVPAPDGTYIAVPAGTQFSYQQPPVWVCVRATLGGPVVPVPGWPPGTTHTFVGFVAPGSPGYRAEPTAAPSQTGGGTSPTGSGSTQAASRHCGVIAQVSIGDLPSGGFVVIGDRKFLVGGVQPRNLTVSWNDLRVGRQACAEGRFVAVAGAPGTFDLYDGSITVVVTSLPSTATDGESVPTLLALVLAALAPTGLALWRKRGRDLQSLHGPRSSSGPRRLARRHG